MFHKWCAVQVSDGLPVVGELHEIHFVRGKLDTGREAEPWSDSILVFGIRLQSRCVELFMEVRQGRVHPGSWIGWSLEPIGFCIFRPHADAENAVFRSPA